MQSQSDEDPSGLQAAAAPLDYNEAQEDAGNPDPISVAPPRKGASYQRGLKVLSARKAAARGAASDPYQPEEKIGAEVAQDVSNLKSPDDSDSGSPSKKGAGNSSQDSDDSDSDDSDSASPTSPDALGQFLGGLQESLVPALAKKLKALGAGKSSQDSDDSDADDSDSDDSDSASPSSPSAAPQPAPADAQLQQNIQSVLFPNDPQTWNPQDPLGLASVAQPSQSVAAPSQDQDQDQDDSDG